MEDAFSSSLLTEAHILIRFDAFSRYPTSLWKLTKKYNQDFFGVAILDFLNTQERFLDAGYSLPLQRDAYRCGSGSVVDVVSFIMSAEVQDELTGILEKASASSLDVERKHNQDKRSETTKVSGCARASRNAIIRRYRTYRETALSFKQNAGDKLNKTCNNAKCESDRD